jgi:hypothetical protein
MPKFRNEKVVNSWMSSNSAMFLNLVDSLSEPKLQNPINP